MHQHKKHLLPYVLILKIPGAIEYRRTKVSGKSRVLGRVDVAFQRPNHTNIMKGSRVAKLIKRIVQRVFLAASDGLVHLFIEMTSKIANQVQWHTRLR